MANTLSPVARITWRAARVITALLLIAAVIAATAASVCGIALDRDLYVQTAGDDTFLNTMYRDVQSLLKDECVEQRGLPYEPFQHTISKDMVQQAVAIRMSSICDAMRGEGQATAVSIDSKPLEDALVRYFASLPAEEQAEHATPEMAKQVADEIVQPIEWLISSGISTRLLDAIRPMFAYTIKLRKFADLSIWLWVAVVALTVINLLPFATSLRKRAYMTAGAWFLGSTAVAVPLWLVIRHDFPSRLAIDVKTDALAQYIRALVNTWSTRSNWLVTLTFGVAVACLMAAIVWMVWPDKQPSEQEKSEE